MTQGTHDTLVYRLSQMLIKLNHGERLDPQDLADEFGVNLRTIQRDLNERFAYLPLQKSKGAYHLDPAFLGKLTTRDIERFAALAGVRGLFPSFSDEFLRDIFDDRMQRTMLVKGHHYENLSGREALFQTIERAIAERRKASFEYEKDGMITPRPDVEPYKLINNKGIWYLAARDAGKVKSFAFTKIERFRVLAETYHVDAEVEKVLKEEDGVWISDAKIEVVLKISREVAGYFKRRKLIANQKIVKELGDGGLILSAAVGHLNQVVPIVRYWIPHIRIISPDGAQAALVKLLADYIGGGN